MSAKLAKKWPRTAPFGHDSSRELMPWTDPVRIFEHCTGCGACSLACPQGIVATGRGGHPYLVFSAACTFCGACADICLEHVFDRDRGPPLAAIAKIGNGCLELKGVSCRACEDLCPEAALRVRPQLGGTAHIEVDEFACTGCGACVSVCPTEAVEIVPHG